MAVDKKISQLASGAPAQAGDEYVVARSGANYKLTLTNIAASMPPIGATTPNTGAFTTVDATTGNITTVNATTVDATNVEVTNVKAKDGTAAITIADSTGNVGIGATAANAATKVEINGTLPTSSNFTLGYDVLGTIPSGTTNSYYGYRSTPSTAAASFTVTNLDHFRAQFGTGGAGSAVTNQIGFHASSSLTGATNNYGFYSNIASGSGRWNFYAAGTADNYFAGAVGIGNTVMSTMDAVNGVGDLVVGSGSGSAGLTVYTGTAGTGGIAFADGTTTTDTYRGYINYAHNTDHMALWTAATERMRIDSSGNVGIGMTPSTDTLLEVYGAAAATCYKNVNTGTGLSDGFYVGCGKSSSTDAYVYNRESAPIIFGTANAERMRIDSSGNVGIGGTAQAYAKVQITGTLPTSGATSVGSWVTGTVPSGTTGDYIGFWSDSGTQATSFTLARASHFYAPGIGVGAGSTVTNQYGFHVASTLTGATNNYGFFSNIASGSNRWNFYAAGTAINYFAGDVLIGTTSKINGTSSPLHAYATTGSGIIVQMTQSDADTISVWNSATSGDNDFIDFYTEGSPTIRGNITYNRGAGQVAYNTTSDYRAKTITGTVTNSGALLDALKVYVGKMNGATVERPMLIAHEAQEIAPYAVSGEKDAVDKDGNPVYQQIDVSSLVPLLIAEVKSLRQRVAELEAK